MTAPFQDEDDTSIVYKISRASGRKPATCQLSGRTFIWQTENSATTISLSDIVGIRIFKSPGMTLVPSYQRCTVTARDGRRWIVASDKFVGGVFGARVDEFRVFVRELVRRVHVANPQAEFRSGLSPAVWTVAVVAFVLIDAFFVGAIGLVIAAGVENGEWAATLFIAAVLSIVFGVNTLRMLPLVRDGRPRVFDPTAPSVTEP